MKPFVYRNLILGLVMKAKDKLDQFCLTEQEKHSYEESTFKMSSSELEDLLRGWTFGNNSTYEYWKKELSDAPQFMTSIKDLEKRAQSSRWKSTLDKLSPKLAANLEIWKRDVFDQKCLANLEFPPYSPAVQGVKRQYVEKIIEERKRGHWMMRASQDSQDDSELIS